MDKNEATMNVEPNLGGLLCYVPCGMGLVFSITAIVVEKKSRFIRFHAFQSVLLQGLAFATLVATMILLRVIRGFLPALGGVVSLGLLGVLLIALLGATIFLMMKANANQEYKLPTLGDMAGKWVAEGR